MQSQNPYFLFKFLEVEKSLIKYMYFTYNVLKKHILNVLKKMSMVLLFESIFGKLLAAVTLEIMRKILEVKLSFCQISGFHTVNSFTRIAFGSEILPVGKSVAVS